MNNDSDKKYFGIYSKNMKYIIPPGLYEVFDNFIAQCKVDMAFNQPILVVGDTGVDKSLFLHIFKKFCEELCKPKIPNVAWANCAHFGGKNSDPGSLAERGNLSLRC